MQDTQLLHLGYILLISIWNFHYVTIVFLRNPSAPLVPTSSTILFAPFLLAQLLCHGCVTGILCVMMYYFPSPGRTPWYTDSATCTSNIRWLLGPWMGVFLVFGSLLLLVLITVTSYPSLSASAAYQHPQAMKEPFQIMVHKIPGETVGSNTQPRLKQIT